MGWKPPAGTTTLVEPVDPEPGREALTATVVDDDRLLLDLGASPPTRQATFDVVASFFTAEALVRATGVLVAVEEANHTLHELIVKDIERVQRRQERRVEIELPASLVVPDAPGPMVSVLGRTVNVSGGGCRIATDEPLPGSEPLVTLALADHGDPVIAQATVLGSEHRGSTWEYRLRFTAIDNDDRVRLEELAAA
jgi:hypothetical protein